MSNYIIQTGWSGKDALADSDPAKVISGDDFNTEFLAVQTAINTKAELNGNVSESFSALTAATGTNTTQVATTAFVQASTPTAATVNSAAYPVGSVYTSVVATNPATLLGVGTWSAFSAGRVMLGAGGGYIAGATGGATTDSHVLSIAEMPAHSHTAFHQVKGAGMDVNINQNDAGQQGGGNTSTTGSGQAHTHDIMQPYIVVYFWKRTA